MSFQIKCWKYIIFSMICLLLNVECRALLAASFTANTLAGCGPLVVQFNNTSTGNPTSYLWTLGNGATSVLQNPSTSYTTPGMYTVTLTVYNGTNSSTVTQTNYITVYPKPTVDFTVADTSVCPYTPITFTNQSNPQTPGPATYSWNFGDGFGSAQQSPTHTYTASGFYNVTLVVTNSQGCSNTITKYAYIHIFPLPTPAFTWPPVSGCNPPITVTFTNTTPNNATNTSNWSFGDGFTSGQTAPTHIYNSNANFQVKLITTDVNGCKDSVTHLVGIGGLFPSFTASNACEGSPVNFTNTTTSSFNSCSWDFGDGFTSTQTSPTHTYASPGTYTVLMTISNSQCSGSYSMSITVYPKPVIAFVANPLPPCPNPVPVEFTNLSTNATSYVWHFGDGYSSTLTNPTHVYQDSGLYSVTLVATSSLGCTDSITMANYVDVDTAILIVLANGLHSTGGCVPYTVNFSNQWSLYTSSPVSNYYWNFGDGFTSNLPNPPHTYNTPGTYTATFTITTANGCSRTDSAIVHVGTLPHASFSILNSTICVHQTVNVQNYSTGATSYVWMWGDGPSNDTGFNVTHTYSVSGVYSITLIAYNNGCSDDTTLTNVVTVNFPTSAFGVTYHCDTTKKVTFNNASLGATSFMWLFGDGATNTTQTSPSHTYSSFGNYTVKLITHNSTTGCSDTLSYPIFLFEPQVNLTTPDTTVCKGTTVTFTPIITNLSGSCLYRWYVNNILIDTTTNFVYTFNNIGIYNIKLTIIDGHGCFYSITKANYMHISAPVVSFTAVPLSGCAPLNVQFTDLSTNITGVANNTRAWTFGDGYTSTVFNTSSPHVYNTAGSFSVKLVVTDALGCKDSLTKPNYITAYKPDPTFNASISTTCIGQSIAFSIQNFSAGTTPVWSFGDGGTSTALQPNHSYGQVGNYDVKLVLTDIHGCKDSLTQPAFIHIVKPVASFDMSDSFTLCPPLSVNFSNTTIGANSYYWTLGSSGVTSTTTNPSNLYTAYGYDTIVLIATNAQGCRDTAIGHVNVLSYNGTFTYKPTSGCSPLDVSFTASLQNVPSIIWDFSDGTTSIVAGSNITNHIYTIPGAYIPKLIVDDGNGCQNSSTGIDTINVGGVIINYTTDPDPVCQFNTVQFQSTSQSFFSPISTYHWIFDNGQTSNIINPTHYYSVSGAIPVMLIITNDSGCVDTLSSTVEIAPKPTASAGNDTTVCAKSNYQLHGTGGSTYIWSPAAGLSSTTVANPSYLATTTTTYTLEVTSSFGCKDTADIHITVNPRPTAAIAVTDTSVCPGAAIQLQGSGSGTSFSWFPTVNMTNNNTRTPTVTIADSINYHFVLFNVYGCSDTATETVTIIPAPTFVVTPLLYHCVGDSIQLYASGSDSYWWFPSRNLSNDTVATPSAWVVGDTIYHVALTEKLCKRSDTFDVEIRRDRTNLVKIIKSSDIDCNHDSVSLTVTGGAYNFSWVNVEDLPDSMNTSTTIIVHPDRPTLYTVAGSDLYGCKNRDSIVVSIIKDGDKYFFSPSGFTPNEDGLNDCWQLKIPGTVTDFKLFIFNRWGNNVYSSKNQYDCWDGKFNGQDQPIGTYFYYYDITTECGKLKGKSDFTLIR
jgi:gliding motility-associated-like protein